MKAVKTKVLCVALITLALTSCSAGTDATFISKKGVSTEHLQQVYTQDKQECKEFFDANLPGIVDHELLNSSYTLCLINKGWSAKLVNAMTITNIRK